MSDPSAHLARGRQLRRSGAARDAASELNRAFELFQRVDDRLGMGRSLVELGLLALDAGELDAATTGIGRSLELLGLLEGEGEGEGEDDADRGRALVATAHVAIAGDDPMTATRLLGAASGGSGPDEMLSDADAGPPIRAARSALDDGVFTREWSIGEALSPAEATSLARARCGVA